MNTADFLKHELSRRQFLGSSAANAAGVAAGMVGLSASSASASPGERLSLGVIGVRNQGRKLAAELAGFADVDVNVLCDVDPGTFADAVQAVEEWQGFAPRLEQDFRRVLDDRKIHAVAIAAPDHWHGAMTVLACRAGKDVYVEKPVSHNVREGEAMVVAAARHGRVIQCGLQQRSGSHFQSAVELVRSGKLGTVNLARAWTVHRRKSIGFKKNTRPPEGLDYNLWLGPAEQRPFNPNRYHHNWHWFWDYGSGELGNWGVHMLDVARWGLSVELPPRVASSGGKFTFNDDQETPDTQVVHFSYPGKTIIWEHRLWSTHGLEGRSTAVAFYGDNGTLVVDRGGWKVYDRKDALTCDTSDQLRTHLRNFVDCIKTRKSPAADILTGHLSTTLCHLGNISHRIGREVLYDPAAGNFGADEQANALLGREYREPWGEVFAV